MNRLQSISTAIEAVRSASSPTILFFCIIVSLGVAIFFPASSFTRVITLTKKDGKILFEYVDTYVYTKMRGRYLFQNLGVRVIGANQRRLQLFLSFLSSDVHPGYITDKVIGEDMTLPWWKRRRVKFCCFDLKKNADQLLTLIQEFLKSDDSIFTYEYKNTGNPLPISLIAFCVFLVLTSALFLLHPELFSQAKEVIQSYWATNF